MIGPDDPPVWQNIMQTSSPTALTPHDLGARLKALRTARHLSMRNLAAQSGVSPGLISKIEAGKVSPTVMSLQKLLTAINVDLYTYFLQPVTDNPAEQIVFRQQDIVASRDQDRKWFYAFPKHPNMKLQLYYEEYRPHTRSVERETHRGDLCGLVLAGELTLDVEGKGTLQIRSGDAFYISAGHRHTARNAGDTWLKLVTVQRL